MQYSVTHMVKRAMKRYFSRKGRGVCSDGSVSPSIFLPLLSYSKSGATASNVKSFEGIPLLSCTLRRCEKIFQFLEAEAQQTLMMLYEGIMISKRGVVKMTKRTVYFTEPAP